MRHPILDSRPATYRLFYVLARSPDHTKDRGSLMVEAKTTGDNFRRLMLPLLEAEIVREHKTSTHEIWSLTPAGIDLARARGVLDGVTPSEPMTGEVAALPRVELATRLVEVLRALEPLEQERKRILEQLAM